MSPTRLLSVWGFLMSPVQAQVHAQALAERLPLGPGSWRLDPDRASVP